MAPIGNRSDAVKEFSELRRSVKDLYDQKKWKEAADLIVSRLNVQWCAGDSEFLTVASEVLMDQLKNPTLTDKFCLQFYSLLDLGIEESLQQNNPIRSEALLKQLDTLAHHISRVSTNRPHWTQLNSLVKAVLFSRAAAVLFSRVKRMKSDWVRSAQAAVICLINAIRLFPTSDDYEGHQKAAFMRFEAAKLLGKLHETIKEPKFWTEIRAFVSDGDKDSTVAKLIFKNCEFNKAESFIASQCAKPSRSFDVAIEANVVGLVPSVYHCCVVNLSKIVWILQQLRNPQRHGFDEDLKLRSLFKDLQLKAPDLSVSNIESFCLLDVQAFLYLCVLVAEKKLAARLTGAPLSILPAVCCDGLVTPWQQSWWTAAYSLAHNCGTSDQRLDLQKGIDAVRLRKFKAVEEGLVYRVAEMFEADASEAARNGDTQRATAMNEYARVYWKNLLSSMESSRSSIGIGRNDYLFAAGFSPWSKPQREKILETCRRKLEGDVLTYPLDISSLEHQLERSRLEETTDLLQGARASTSSMNNSSFMSTITSAMEDPSVVEEPRQPSHPTSTSSNIQMATDLSHSLSILRSLVESQDLLIRSVMEQHNRLNDTVNEMSEKLGELTFATKQMSQELNEVKQLVVSSVPTTPRPEMMGSRTPLTYSVSTNTPTTGVDLKSGTVNVCGPNLTPSAPIAVSDIFTRVSSAPPVVKAGSKPAESIGFGDKFKIPVGPWNCRNCYRQNSADDSICVCCGNDKDGQRPKSSLASAVAPVPTAPATTSQSSVFSKFSFGVVSPSTKPAEAASVTPATSVTATQFMGFGQTSTKSPMFGGVGQTTPVAAASTTASPATSLFRQPLLMTPPSIPAAKTYIDAFKKPSDFQGFGTTSSPVIFKPPTVPATTVKSPEPDDTVEEFEPEVHFTPVIPLPNLVEVKTGEENEDVLFCHRAKLFRFDFVTGEFKERGIGDLKILRHKHTLKTRVLMRREQVLKLCANLAITKDMELMPMQKSDKAFTWTCQDFSEEKLIPETLAARFKTSEMAEEFKRVFTQCVGDAAAGKTIASPLKSPMTPQQGFGGQFKPPAGSWSCSSCYAQNSQEHSACVCCGCGKDGQQPKATIQATTFAAPSSTAFTFGFGSPSIKPAEEKTITVTPAFAGFGVSAAATPAAPSLFSQSAASVIQQWQPSTGQQPSLFNGFGGFNGPSPTVVPTSPEIHDDDKVEEFEPQVHFAPVIPLPNLVEVRTGEENEEVLFCQRVKLFRFDTALGEFKERGIGDLKILRHKETGKSRVLMRREQVLKVCANHFLTKGMHLNPMQKSDKAYMWLCQDFSEEVVTAETLAARFKTSEMAEEFKKFFNQCVSEAETLTSPLKPSGPNVAPVETAAAQGFGEKFKLPSGSWNCPACYAQNTGNDCACCGTSRDGKAPKPAEQILQPPITTASTFSAFSFGRTTTAASVTPAEVKTPPTSTPLFGASVTSAFAGFGKGITGGSPAVAAPTATTTELFGHIPATKPISFGSIASFTNPSNIENATMTPPTTTATGTGLFGQSLFGQTSTAATSLTFGSLKESPNVFQKPADFKGFGGEGSQVFGSLKAPAVPASPGGDDNDDRAEEFEPQVNFTPVIPLPNLIEVKTGEENEEVLFCERSKMFRYDSALGEFKERGIGELKILRHKETGKCRVLMRREQVYKLCANHVITKTMELRPLQKSDKAYTWVCQDFSEEVLTTETLAARFKTSEMAERFKQIFTQCANESFGSPMKEPSVVQSAQGANQVGFGEKFRLPTGSWNCPGCYATNEAEKSVCVCCGSTKTGQPVPGDAGTGQLQLNGGTKPPVSTAFKFGFQSPVAPPPVSVVVKEEVGKASEDELEILYSAVPTEEQIERARKYQLPDTFYLYEDRPGCPGCPGCEEEPQTPASSDSNSDEMLTVFEKNATLMVKISDDQFEEKGNGMAKICYEKALEGYHIFFHSVGGEELMNHVIAKQYSVKATCGTVRSTADWEAVDFVGLPERKFFRLAFSSSADCREFRDLFEKGREMAEAGDLNEFNHEGNTTGVSEE